MLQMTHGRPFRPYELSTYRVNFMSLNLDKKRGTIESQKMADEKGKKANKSALKRSPIKWNHQITAIILPGVQRPEWRFLKFRNLWFREFSLRRKIVALLYHQSKKG